MKPSRSILDPAFPYTPSGETDLKKTFAKQRKKIKDELERRERERQNITPLHKGSPKR